MAHYAIVMVEVKDAEKMAAYREAAGPGLAKHGAKPVAGGPETRALQAQHGPVTGVVLEFSDADAIENWLSDPELAEVHALRNAAATVTILAAPSMG
ncbi:MAG: DUF1330 domain-containing protein [Pseudomonadota bacterium]